MNTISQKQFNAIFFLGFLCMNFLTFPARLTQISGSDGIISLLISCVFSYTGIIAIIKTVNYFKFYSFNDVLTTLFGKAFSKVVAFFYLCNMLYLCAYSIRLLSEQISIYMLRQISIVPIEAVFLSCSLVLSNKSVKCFGTFCRLFFKVIVICLLFIVFMSISNARADNMLPLFNTGITDIAMGSVAMSAYLFSAVIALPCLLGKVKDFDEQKAYKDMAYIVIAVFVIYSAYYFLCVTVLGQQLTSRYIFPALCVIQSSKYDNVLMQRYEIVLIMSVVTLYFVYSSLIIRSAGELICDKSEKKTKKANIFFAVLVFAVIMILNDVNVGSLIIEFIDINNVTFPHNFLITVIAAGFYFYKKRNIRAKNV